MASFEKLAALASGVAAAGWGLFAVSEVLTVAWIGLAGTVVAAIVSMVNTALITRNRRQASREQLEIKRVVDADRKQASREQLEIKRVVDADRKQASRESNEIKAKVEEGRSGRVLTEERVVELELDPLDGEGGS